MSCRIFWIIRRLLYLIRSENEEHADFLSQQPGVMFAQISLSKTLNGGLSTAISSKGLFVSTNMLDMNGYTYDTQMTQGNYTGVDLILSKD